MIYIVAGIAKSGKSMVAQTLLKEHHLNIISTDLVMMMLHHAHGQAIVDIHKSDVTVSTHLKPYLQGIIKTLVSFPKDYVIEGVHIQPDFAYALSQLYPNNIKTIFLGYKNQNPHEKAKELKRYEETMDNPWFNQMNEDQLIDLTTYMIRESEKLYHACQIYQQPYVEISNIQTQMPDIIDQLLK